MGLALTAANRIVRTTNVPSYDANYAALFWIQFAAKPAASAYATLFTTSVNNAGGPIDALVLFGTSGTVTNLRWYSNDEGGTYTDATGATNLAINTPYCVAIRRSANNSRIVYLGTLTTILTQEVNYTTTQSGRTVPSRMDFGAFGSGNGDPYTGSLFSPIIWAQDVPLVTLINQQQHKRPIEFPVNGAYPHLSAGILDDHCGGNAWTAVGTPVAVADPPIMW
jgi:hypothetical protein